MYDIIFPFLGFEEIKKVSLKDVDENFSTLILDETKNIQLQIVNINYLNNLKLDFEIEDKILQKLNIAKRDELELYFCLVVQDPIKYSIVNLIAPILINKKDKLIGQYVTKSNFPKLFITVEEATTL